MFDPQWSIVNFHLGNIFRKLNKTGTGFLGLRHFKSFANNFRNHFRADNSSGVFGDGQKHRFQIQDLMRFFMQAIGRSLTGNGYQGGMIHIGISHTGNQIGRTRTECRHTDSCTASESTINICHKGRTLFMPGGNKLNGGIQQGVHDIQILLTGNTKNIFHTFIFQSTDK